MFECKPYEFTVILVYKTDDDSSFEYIARIKYYNRKTSESRIDPEFLAFDNYQTLGRHLRELGFLCAGRTHDDPLDLVETWI